jgi:hypothetical protein
VFRRNSFSEPRVSALLWYVLCKCGDIISKVQTTEYQHSEAQKMCTAGLGSLGTIVLFREALEGLALHELSKGVIWNVFAFIENPQTIGNQHKSFGGSWSLLLVDSGYHGHGSHGDPRASDGNVLGATGKCLSSSPSHSCLHATVWKNVREIPHFSFENKTPLIHGGSRSGFKVSIYTRLLLTLALWVPGFSPSCRGNVLGNDPTRRRVVAFAISYTLFQRWRGRTEGQLFYYREDSGFIYCCLCSDVLWRTLRSSCRGCASWQVLFVFLDTGDSWLPSVERKQGTSSRLFFQEGTSSFSWQVQGRAELVV